MARPRRIIPGLNDNEGGRPHGLNEPHDQLPDGTPRTVSEAIVAHVENGEYLKDACHLVGIPVGTGSRWLLDGARAERRTQNSDEWTEYETVCAKFRAGYLHAQATRTAHYLSIADDLIAGGRRVVSTRTEIRFRNDRDTEGYPYRRWNEVSVLPPNLGALQWRLAHMDPARFDPRLRVIQTDGAELSEEDEWEVLADKMEADLGAYFQGREDAKAEAEAQEQV